jgi:hypothetical protein
MSQKLFVNIAAADISRALVRSVTDMTPVAFPKLVVGDGRSYELYLVDGLGDFASFSGSGAYTPFVAIGNCGYPTGGTWTAAFGVNTTAALAWNISPAALQTALQGLASIGANNVSVTGSAGKYYVVTFIGALAGTNVAEIVVNAAGLLPESGIDVSTIVQGGSGVNEVQLLTFAVNPLTFADDWTTIANGWTGELSTRTVAVIQAFAAAGGTITELFQVTIADPDLVRTTYAKVTASIQCTIINPESFAGTDKPTLVTSTQLAAAVLGANNFTREAITSAATGNSNVTRATTSRHHVAVITVTGTAGIRTFSLLTTNSPQPGDTVFLDMEPAAVAGLILRFYNASPAGTLLGQITTTASGSPYFLIFVWDGSAWNRAFSDGLLLNQQNNLADLANVLTSKANLRTLFSRVAAVQTANFTIVAADDGKYIPVSTAAGNVLATLPVASAVDPGFLIAIQKADASVGTVSTTPATAALTALGQIVVFMSDGTSWIVLLQSGGSGNTLAASTNPAGNTTLTPTAAVNVAVVTLTGSAGTRILILNGSGAASGALVKLRVVIPATAAIVIEIRNLTSVGTLLYTITSDGTAANAFFELYFDGTNFKPLSNVFPVV